MSIFVRQFRNLVRFFTPLGQAIPAPSELLDSVVLLHHDLTANGWEWLTSEWRFFETTQVSAGGSVTIDLVADPGFNFRIFLLSGRDTGAVAVTVALQLLNPNGGPLEFQRTTLPAGGIGGPIAGFPSILPEGFTLRTVFVGTVAGDTVGVSYFLIRVPVGDSLNL